MAETVTLSLASSSDAATEAALAYGLTFLHPEQAQALRDRLKGIHLRSGSLEVDVDTDQAGPLRVAVRLALEPG